MTGKNNTIAFAVLAWLESLVRRWRQRGHERPGEIDEPLGVTHHHERANGELVWHFHATKLDDHPIALERGHPDA